MWNHVYAFLHDRVTCCIVSIPLYIFFLFIKFALWSIARKFVIARWGIRGRSPVNGVVPCICSTSYAGRGPVVSQNVPMKMITKKAPNSRASYPHFLAAVTAKSAITDRTVLPSTGKQEPPLYRLLDTVNWGKSRFWSVQKKTIIYSFLFIFRRLFL